MRGEHGTLVLTSIRNADTACCIGNHVGVSTASYMHTIVICTEWDLSDSTWPPVKLHDPLDSSLGSLRGQRRVQRRVKEPVLEDLSHHSSVRLGRDASTAIVSLRDFCIQLAYLSFVALFSGVS